MKGVITMATLTKKQQEWALEKARELIKQLNDEGEDFGGLPKAAAKIGLTKSLLSQLCNYKYESGRKNEHIMKIYQYFEIKESAAAQEASPTAYVPTSISEDVQKHLAYCQQMGSLMTICGDAGIGKTRAILQYVKEHSSNTIHIKMKEGFTGVKIPLVEICKAMGIKATGGLYTLSGRVSDALKDGMLIIVDEAQHMTLKQIDHLRAYCDEKEEQGESLGIAFVGNHRTTAHFSGTAESDLGQVSQRRAYQVKYRLSDIKRHDIQLMYPDIAEDKPVIDFLYELTQRGKGIRGISKLYVNAKNAESLDFDTFVALAKKSEE